MSSGDPYRPYLSCCLATVVGFPLVRDRSSFSCQARQDRLHPHHSAPFAWSLGLFRLPHKVVESAECDNSTNKRCCGLPILAKIVVDGRSAEPAHCCYDIGDAPSLVSPRANLCGSEGIGHFERLPIDVGVEVHAAAEADRILLHEAPDLRRIIAGSMVVPPGLRVEFPPSPGIRDRWLRTGRVG